jgi:predicted aspartyl protease
MWGSFNRVSRVMGLLGLILAAMAMLSGCSVSVGQVDQVGPSNGTSASVQVVTDEAGGVTVLAPVMIEGHGPYIFVVDTGASVSLIDRRVAMELNLKVSGSAQQVEGIGGVQTVVPVNVSGWNLGQIKLPTTTIDKTSFSSQELGGNAVGLLGSDIWNQFGAVTIDYTNQTITVYKQLSKSSATSPTIPV